ncbi:C-terminal binding protein [Opitutus sp. GAS368]|uniref:C-terminal binding protein n=1 Tax=Opitutus sp. GAS368 TaxID=1882749 RepID=UPI00087BDF73|nr:C-terminal binding protein [Opitutus sp. GAS368]SDS49129.1 D-3-phosphoglycerate dehydrogenase [Opitutus sp. GAS368]
MPSRPQIVNVDCNFTYELERRRIEAAGADLVLRRARTEDEIILACRDAAVVLFENADTPLNARVIAALPKCQAIVRYGVGVDSIDLVEATRQGVVVANSADYCTEEVSDHSTALILAAARRIAVLDRRIRSGGWVGYDPQQPLRRVACLTLGLLGWGRIAQAVARKMSGFNMRIIVADPYVQSLPPGSPIELVSRDQLLRESDLLSLHLPLNVETRHLMNEQTLGLMKPTAYLVNTSRGGIIDEAALVRALQQDRLGGAALDVFEVEPLPAPSPLRTLEQVTLTPHYAASSQDSMRHLHGTVTDSVEALLGGHWPPFPVNGKVVPREALRPWKDFRPGR